MTARELCDGLPPEWWEPRDAGARLAVAICRRCPGCHDDDPDPHGVIRHGIPYTDTGQPMLLCEVCGYPNVDYRGGAVTPCGRCLTPRISIPNRVAIRRSRIAHLFRLGLDDHAISAEVGVSARVVQTARQQAGLLRQPSTKPIERTTA